MPHNFLQEFRFHAGANGQCGKVWRQLYGVISTAPISSIKALKSLLAKLAAVLLPL